MPDRTLILVLLACLAAIQGSAEPLVLYVSPRGDDRWSGRLEKPAPGGLDGPVQSLTTALARIREARQPGLSVPESTTIFLLEGLHTLGEPVVLGPRDSGHSPERPLLIAAYRNHRPVLSGGRLLRGWSRDPDNPGLWRAPSSTPGEGPWNFHQLFVNGRRYTRARTPNTGYFRMEGAPLSDQPIRFRYREGEFDPSWAGAAGIEIVGLQKWIDYRQPIVEVDAGSRVLTLAGAFAPHTREPDARYYAENFSEALDRPGEWHLDAGSGTVTCRPEAGENLSKAEVVAPKLASELIRFEGDFKTQQAVRHVVLRGLTFAFTDWTQEEQGYTDVQAAVGIRGHVRAEGATDCVIENCTFTHLGGYGLELGKGCQRWLVAANEFKDLAGGGIRLGDPRASESAFEECNRNVITDNHLHHLGRVYAPAVGIIVFQSGRNRIANNHIHHLYYTGISVGWNWGYQETPCRENVIEFNHIHDAGQGVLSDLGGIYTLGIQRGTVIRNNRIHDIYSDSYGGWGIYTDEGSSDILIENNLVYRCKSALFHQHYGRNNVIRNNIFAFGLESQLMRTREEAHFSFLFRGNIVYYDSGTLLGSHWSNNLFQMDNNLYFDTRAGATEGSLRFKEATLAEWRQRGHDVNSLFADPMFLGPRKDDFRLRIDSPAFKLGFTPIDYTQMGVRKKFRKQVGDMN